MIWVVWRQQRAQLISLLALLVVGGAAVAALGFSMLSYVDSHGLQVCLAGGLETNSLCRQGVNDFQNIWFDRMKAGQLVITVLPVLVGMFCGAPLFARELEQGTHVLAFTQSVSRIRWMASKFAVTVPPALVVVLGLQLLVEWWVSAAGAMGPLATGPFFYLTFDGGSTAPVAYTVFALALGAFVGAAFRRTLVGMTVTLAVFTAARIAMFTVRRYLLPAQRVVSDDPTESAGGRYSLVVHYGFLDAKGAQVPYQSNYNTNCGSTDATSTSVDYATCYRQHGLAKSFADIIPADASGALHLVDSAIFVGLAALLVLATGWAVRRQA
ncbi:hypothetical protein [Kutzneria sp. NPDC052558]|uniref:hypothetical protein n=1 Tax=Kutzneria sp. NPDC052558 TaxID=3364121 RepID=UPI0037C7ED57